MRTTFLPILLFALVASACARGVVSSPLPESVPPVTAAHAGAVVPYRILYSFKGVPDGAQPEGGLLPVNGVMYGTTFGGGVSGCSSGSGSGCGTVFRVRLSGTERVIHRFGNGADGANPVAGLIGKNGLFYGTTVDGGANGNGAVFDVNPFGAERVLYSFKGAPDGAKPEAALSLVNDTLYGTTYGGGDLGCSGSPSGCGTAFSVGTSGTESVIHRFGIRPDGSLPESNLVMMNGVFYGTTLKRTSNEGGAACGIGIGCGVVFEMTADGQESVLYRFLKRPDGSNPATGLVVMGGSFYGTTTNGGTNGKGTVFEVSTTGVEQILHSFAGFGDGANPFGRLTAVKGVLYGTTYNGGKHGMGTLFKITASGVKTILHNFAGGIDGAHPRGGLVASDGVVYGTTEFGGPNNSGTVFSHLP